MIVIADTSPLHYLILLEHAHVLRDLYGRMLIPEAVARELRATKTPALVRQWVNDAPDWLEVRKVTTPADAALARLDDGEREAIVLAEQLSADAVLLDERAGRREAQRRKLRVIGTVRILDDAAELGLLEPLIAIARLRTLGFYLDAALVKFLSERHSERLRRRNI